MPTTRLTSRPGHPFAFHTTGGTTRALVLAAGAAIVAIAGCTSDTTNEAGGAASNQTTQTAGSTTDALTPEASEAPSGAGTPITITAGDQTFTAVLNDTQVAQDFAEMLPVTLPWFRNAGIEYITELDAPLTETGPFYTDVQPGDLVYYNPLDSITIIYSETSSVPTLTKMGEVTSDLAAFESLPDNLEIRIAAE